MSHLQKMVPLLALSLMLQACGTTRPGKQPPQEDAIAPPAAKTGSVTVENLLRWPLEGTGGTEKILAALDQVFEMKPLRASQSSGQGPVRLADGHVLSFAYVRKLSGDIDIGIDQNACVSPDWAVKVTGAVLNPVYQDAHGVDRGKQYDATGNGMVLRINTTPETYRCVTALHIYPSPKERP